MVKGARGHWKLKVFYVKLRGPAEQQENGLAFCQPISTDPLSQLVALWTSGLSLGMLLTLRAATILRCRTRWPHIVVRLSTPIIRGIFVRHRTVHVAS
jgi:hypothetical protein